MTSLYHNNIYLVLLGSSLADRLTLGTLVRSAGSASAEAVQNEVHEVVSPILDQALKQIQRLDILGLSERFDESVELIFRTLSLPQPEEITPARVTDELAVMDSRFSKVPPVTMTLRSARALDHLTQYDQVIYSAAKHRFDRLRRAKH